MCPSGDTYEHIHRPMTNPSMLLRTQHAGFEHASRGDVDNGVYVSVHGPPHAPAGCPESRIG
jgi:hypothetical protein